MSSTFTSAHETNCDSYICTPGSYGTATITNMRTLQSFGPYANMQVCNDALNNSRDGFICALGSYGTATITNMRTQETVGQAFSSFQSCLEALNTIPRRH